MFKKAALKETINQKETQKNSERVTEKIYSVMPQAISKEKVLCNTFINFSCIIHNIVNKLY